MPPLILHPTLGVNPHLTVCPRCGGDSPEIVMVGAHDYADTCSSCGLVVYGGFGPGRRCPRCQSSARTRRKLDELERLPGSRPCEKCTEEIARFKAAVADGGVYFRCPKGHEGVIKSGPFAARVRETSGVAAPAPVGIDLDIETCPVCSPPKSEEPQA